MIMHRCISVILSALLLAASGAVWSAKSALGDIPVRAMFVERAVTRPLAATLPDQAHVLIFVDANSAQSQALLAALQRDGYPGYRTSLVLLGSDERANVGTIALGNWANAASVQASRANAAAALGAARFPVVVGVDGDGREVWRRYPKSNRNVSQLVVRMLEWLQ